MRINYLDKDFRQNVRACVYVRAYVYIRAHVHAHLRAQAIIRTSPQSSCIDDLWSWFLLIACLLGARARAEASKQFALTRFYIRSAQMYVRGSEESKEQQRLGCKAVDRKSHG